MNKNIEVNNKNLWAVNFDYVKMGYITELPFIEGSDDTNPYALLTQNGVIILNRQNELYDTFKKMLIRIMPYSDEVLVDCIKKMTEQVERPHEDKFEEVLLCVYQWEEKRRNVESQYLKDNRKPFNVKGFMQKIIKRKAGDK